MYNRKMYELFIYDEEGKNPQYPIYLRSLKELVEKCGEHGITFSTAYMSKNIVGKVPASGGQSIRIRVYTTYLLDIIDEVNRSLSKGEPFTGIHTPPENTLEETMEVHGLTHFHKDKKKLTKYGNANKISVNDKDGE